MYVVGVHRLCYLAYEYTEQLIVFGMAWVSCLLNKDRNQMKCLARIDGAFDKDLMSCVAGMGLRNSLCVVPVAGMGLMIHQKDQLVPLARHHDELLRFLFRSQLRWLPLDSQACDKTPVDCAESI